MSNGTSFFNTVIPNTMKDFRFFLKSTDVFSIIVGWSVGMRIKDLSSSIFDNIVDPLLDYDWNRDGTSDKKQLSELYFNIGDIKITYGKVILDLIKTIIIIYIIFYIARIIKSFI